MAAALLFYDLSLRADDTSSSSSRPILAAARALELGYAAVALDHPHRGLLADSHRCRTQLSSIPLPSSAALRRRHLASPISEPFRHYTRITLSLDSAAAAASALAPSAARLLRTYDIVAARPLTQAAFDHLCQVPYSQQLDLISIDFSHKLPFRLKLPMLKIALQRGLHFEIAYSPIIATDVNSRKNLLAEAKLLVDWTKGKNLIISSAAHTATEIRGPYDVINLCAYLLGLPMHRAKAAISTNCRSLISKALRKKHFYKETIRIDRLLPDEQLNSVKFKLDDWIGWDSVSCTGDPQSLKAHQLEPSSSKDGLPSSPTYGMIELEASHEKLHNPDASVTAKLLEQSTNEEEIPSQTQEEIVQVDGGEVLMDSGLSILPTSFGHQNSVLGKPGNNEDVLDHFVQDGSGHSVDLESIDKHVEFVQDAMEVDVTESCTLNLLVADSVPSTKDTSIKLASSVLAQGMEPSGTNLEHKGPGQSSEILDKDNSYTKYCTDCAALERGETPLDLEIPSGFNACPRNKDVGHSNDIPVDSEACGGTAKPVECPPGGIDDEEAIERSMDENMEQTAVVEVESTAAKTRRNISVEPMFHCQETSSTGYIYNKRPPDASCQSDELKDQNSEETFASLEREIAETHQQLLNCSYPSVKVEIPPIKSEKQRRKLRSHHPVYCPFLGLLKSLHFKKYAK